MRSLKRRDARPHSERLCGEDLLVYWSLVGVQKIVTCP